MLLTHAKARQSLEHWRRKYGDDDVNQGIAALANYVSSSWLSSWHTHAGVLLPRSLLESSSTRMDKDEDLISAHTAAGGIPHALHDDVIPKVTNLISYFGCSDSSAM